MHLVCLVMHDDSTNERKKTENQKIRPLTFHYDSWKFLFTMENMNEESIKNLWDQYKLLHLDGICRVNLFNRKWPNLHFSQMNHNKLVSPPPIPYILSKDILLLGSQGNQRISFLLNSTNGKIMQSKTISNIFSPLQNACEKLLVYYRALAREKQGLFFLWCSSLHSPPSCRTSAFTAALLGHPFSFLSTVPGSQRLSFFQSHSTIDGRSDKSSDMSDT